MKSRVVLVLAALFTACANGQTPQGVLRGYIATGYDLPLLHNDPIQMRVTSDGKYLVYEGENPNTGEQALYLKCLTCQDTSWHLFCTPADLARIAAPGDPHPEKKFFRVKSKDPYGDPFLAPLVVTNGYAIASAIDEGMPDDWIPRTVVSIALADHLSYPIFSLQAASNLTLADGSKITQALATRTPFTVGSDGRLYSVFYVKDYFRIFAVPIQGGEFMEVTPAGLNDNYRAISQVLALGDHLLANISSGDSMRPALALVDTQTNTWRMLINTATQPILGSVTDKCCTMFGENGQALVKYLVITNHRGIFRVAYIDPVDFAFTMAISDDNYATGDYVTGDPSAVGASKAGVLIAGRGYDMNNVGPTEVFFWDGQKDHPVVGFRDSLFGQTIGQLGPAPDYHLFSGLNREAMSVTDAGDIWLTVRFVDGTQKLVRLTKPRLDSITPASVEVGGTITLAGSFGGPDHIVGDIYRDIQLTCDKGSSSSTICLAPTTPAQYNLAVRTFVVGGYVDSNSLPLTVTAPPPPPSPVITAVVNSASYASGATSPCGNISVYGEHLTTRDSARAPGIPLPRNLDGTQVLIDSVPTAIFYRDRTQINAQMRCEMGNPSRARVQVIADGRTSNEVVVDVAQTSPGIFRNYNYGVGNIQPAIVTDGRGDLVKLERGIQVAMYCTGLGYAVGSRTGEGAPLGATAVNPVRIKVGGATAVVTYAGMTYGLVGLYQVNFVVPPFTPGQQSTVPVTLETDQSSDTAVALAKTP